MKTFETLESEVRSYCRSWPTVFSRAKGSELFNEQGRRYIDLFAGAGALNYGHNHPVLKEALIEYLSGDNITHGLDMATTAKRRFLLAFKEIVLDPRGMNYKMQFPGPTGTNSVEAAIKLARKVTGRHSLASFTNAFHGMTLGSLALTGNGAKRAGAGVPLGYGVKLPFAGYMEGSTDSLNYFESLLSDSSSGMDKLAAVILETIQAEGGVNVASDDWLRRLRDITRRHDVLLIIDDVQVGCGRTGNFFSFERAGIEPDIVCLSKSLSGYGCPMALVLVKPEYDCWDPGEHNGTFRGFNPAFVTATRALEHFWEDKRLTPTVLERGAQIEARLDKMAAHYNGRTRGLGMILGLELDPGLATAVAGEAFKRGVVIETSGAQNEVLKVLPALTISPELLTEGLDVVEACLDDLYTTSTPRREGPDLRVAG